MKRILSTLLIFVLLISAVPISLTASAATSGTTGDCTWTLNGTELTISGNGTMGDYTYDSPAPWGCDITSVVIENGVTTIGNEAFSDCYDLTSVTIGNGVTTIGDSAFYNCDGLTSVTIPGSVTTIGEGAFASCYYLTSVTIPDSVTSIGDSAFYWCESLTSVTIGNGVTTIGDSAFNCCTGLISLTIPDSVTTIGDDAFSDCDSLTSVTIGNSVTSIGGWAFFSCDSLTSVTIPDSVTSIGDSAFYWCESLTSVTIPDSVTSIGYSAFYGCSGLTSVTIPDSVTSIGYSAFYGCSGLTSVTIPDSVITIGDTAFLDCDGLTSIVVDEDNENYCSENGVLFSKDKTRLICYPKGKSGAYVIPDTVTTIGDYAFEYCDGLTSITIPDSGITIGDTAFKDCSGLISIVVDEDNENYCSENGVLFSKDKTRLICYPDGKSGDYVIPDTVTSIGRAFADCDGLTSVIIGNSITTIGDYAFEYCDGLTSITIPDSVTSIGNSAFCNCDSLTSVTIGNGVTTIGDSAFEACESLTSVTIPDSVTTIGEDAFQYCTSLTSVTIPDSVTTIGNSAFEACESLTSVTIPDSVTTIGDNAFFECDGLTSVTIGNGVTSIGGWAFFSCDNLTSVTITDSVTTIGNSAFYYCDSLTSVTIGNGVTSIGAGAFSGCNGLTSIVVDEDNENYCSENGILFSKDKTSLICYPAGKNGAYVIPDTVTTIGEDAFQHCTSLTSVTTGNGVTSIGAGAFYGCNGLTSVIIGNGVTIISNFAFYGCDSLTSITIPDSVTTIGEETFCWCSDLRDVWYGGSADDRKSIAIGFANGYLINATWHYNTCSTESHTYLSACDTTCENCEWVRETTHKYSDYIYNNDATAEKDGTKTRTCSVCGKKETITATAVANINGVPYYNIKDALSAATDGQTIALSEDVSVDYITVNPGVTLDLNGKTLTADYIIGFSGSAIVGEGTIVVDKDKVVLDLNNEDSLPVYNGTSYSFISSVPTQEMKDASGKDTVYYFLPNMAAAHEALLAGAANSGVKVVVRLSWYKEGNYTAVQNYVYMDSMVQDVINSYAEGNYGRVFTATFAGAEAVANDVSGLKVSAVLVSDTGVEISSDGISFDAPNA